MKTSMCLIVVALGVFFNLDASGIGKETISYQYGRELLLRSYQKCKFENGSWGHDIALIVPHVFNVKGKGWFALLSFAEQSYSDCTAWEILGLGEKEFKYGQEASNSIGDLWFDPQELYLVTDCRGCKRLCFHRECYQRAMHPKYVVSLVDSDWWEIVVGDVRLEKRHLFQGGIGSFFKEKDFKSIRMVECHRYRGPNAELVKFKDEKGQWLNAGSLERAGRFPELIMYEFARRFDEIKQKQGNWQLLQDKVHLLAEQYQQMLRKNDSSRKLGKVYYVPCDVNADGKCDAYVTSESEGRGDGIMRWTLLLGNENGFSPLRETRSIAMQITEVLHIDPVVNASTNDFYRIERLNQPGYVLITEKSGDSLESYAYNHHDSVLKSFRKLPGFAKATFNSVHDDKARVTRLDDLAIIPFTDLLEAERLQCHSVSPGERGRENGNHQEEH